MKLTRDIDPATLMVRSCEAGVIVVGETRVTSHLVLSPGTLLENWEVTDVTSLQLADFAPLIAMQPDVILLGTGGALVFPDPIISGTLLEKGIGFEVMDTLAACRTYNILAMDGRSVVAALMQVSAK